MRRINIIPPITELETATPKVEVFSAIKKTLN